jgi:hypothetical protein
MPEGNDDMEALVPEFFGVLFMKIFLPDGQGEKAENPDVYSGDDLKENPIFPIPCVHNGLNSKFGYRIPRNAGGNESKIQRTYFLQTENPIVCEWVLRMFEFVVNFGFRASQFSFT